MFSSFADAPDMSPINQLRTISNLMEKGIHPGSLADDRMRPLRKQHRHPRTIPTFNKNNDRSSRIKAIQLSLYLVFWPTFPGQIRIPKSRRLSQPCPIHHPSFLLSLAPGMWHIVDDALMVSSFFLPISSFNLFDVLYTIVRASGRTDWCRCF